jgi:HPt (histidine-containing phosphotransfer) domain-containing protein
MANVPSDADRVVVKWTPARMLARLDGDRELAVQLVGIFINEYPSMLQRLRDAVNAGSADDVRRAAHALKGSSSNFIDGGPTATAFELETMGRNGQLDGTQPLLNRLDRELIALTGHLREFQSKGRA